MFITKKKNTVYFVCFVPRSGSSHLASMLRSCGAGIIREYFKPINFSERCSEHGVLASTPKDYFSKIKWMQGQTAGFKTDVNSYEVMLKEGVEVSSRKHFYLRRRDKLRQAISWIRSEATDMWYNVEGEHYAGIFHQYDYSKYIENSVFSAESIFAKLAIIKEQEERWESHLKEVSCIRLFYDDLQPALAKSLAADLGCDTMKKCRSVYKIQRDQLTKDWVAKIIHDHKTELEKWSSEFQLNLATLAVD